MTLFWTSEAKLCLYEIHDRQAGCFSLCTSDEVHFFFFFALQYLFLTGMVRNIICFSIKM